MNAKYSIVVPLYNEEAVIGETYKRLKKVMDGVGEPYELVLVNDGSRDETMALAAAICEKDKNVKLINFSRNFGHQVAITAGMDYTSGEAIAVIDADLQDPPGVIPQMIEKWKEGYDVVYGKRVKRKGETFFKKFTAKLFYRALASLTTVKIPVDTGDFRLIDRKVCDALKQLPERNRYVRGLVSWAGFKQTAVEYVREERFAGETKYPLKKMLKFAADGITSFSDKPLKWAGSCGVAMSGVSFLYLAWVLVQKVAYHIAVPIWASVMAFNMFWSGVIMIMLGVMGAYVGRIYDEVKGRPLYIVAEKVNFEEE